MNFFRKMEHFFINLVIIILISLITIQLVMKNDAAYQRLKEMEFAIKNFFQEEPVVEVFRYNKIEEERIVVIDLLQNYALPQVWLVKNGQRVANFAEGYVETSVNAGDLLVIDCKFSNEPLWFEITKVSPDIRTWYIGQQFRIYGEEKKLGIVQYYDKL